MGKLSHFKVFVAEPIDGCEHCYKKMEDLGAELSWGPPMSQIESQLPPVVLAEKLKDKDAVIVMARERFPEEVLKSAPKLRIISKQGRGIDHINIPLLERYNIMLAFTSIMSASTVAEHAFAMMMAAIRKLPKLDAAIRSGKWRDPAFSATELRDKVVGIVGLGMIGSEFARRLSGWDVKLLSYDPHVDSEKMRHYNCKKVELDTLLRESDIISLHLPLLPETTGIIDSNAFSLMKPNCILINTARGMLIEENALIHALQMNQIACACIDTFWRSPINMDHPIFKMDNVVLTPHFAGSANESLTRVAEQVTENVIRALTGEMPEEFFIVSKNGIESWKKHWLK
jgi:D-3-phosphoglycerate dehydrogenase